MGPEGAEVLFSNLLLIASMFGGVSSWSDWLSESLLAVARNRGVMRSSLIPSKGHLKLSDGVLKFHGCAYLLLINLFLFTDVINFEFA